MNNRRNRNRQSRQTIQAAPPPIAKVQASRPADVITPGDPPRLEVIKLGPDAMQAQRDVCTALGLPLTGRLINLAIEEAN